MALQATALGLSLHMMGGFSAANARETFAIPDRWEPIAAISIGYPADPNTLPDELRAKDLHPATASPSASSSSPAHGDKQED